MLPSCAQNCFFKHITNHYWGLFYTEQPTLITTFYRQCDKPALTLGLSSEGNACRVHIDYTYNAEVCMINVHTKGIVC